METDNLIEKKRKRKNINLKKKLNILYSTYFLTYKSLSNNKIIVFWTCLAFASLFLILGINNLSNRFLITIPSYGGTLNEGVVGVPRYVNPVLAKSDTDKDLVSLIYSGILKKDKDGNLVNDLASTVVEEDDGLSYTITLNNTAVFQDGKKITSDDVIFTVSKIEDKDLNSPLSIDFEGVTIEKIDDNTIIFHLKKPFTYFKESLTFGILPKHLWSNISNDEFLSSTYNTNPIGSGPYKIRNVNKKSNNIPTKYELIENKNYLSGRPYIDNINIYIYQNNNDLLSSINSGNVDTTNYLNQNYFDKVENRNKYIVSSELTDLFYISLNPTKNQSLINSNLRSALDKSINKNDIINNIFFSYARKVDTLFNNKNITTDLYENYDVEMAKNLLAKIKSNTKDKKDISQNQIEIDLATADVEDLKKVANKVAEDWAQIGIKTNVKIYSLSDIGEIIKKRDFEALLFGSMINYDTDLYAYWHSSQRNYPGLNITGYTSKNLDKNLEILKNSIDKDLRDKALVAINKELKEEAPAILIYSNNSNYLINTKKINAKEYIPKAMLNGNERFAEVSNWYIYKEKVWKISYIKDLIEKLQNIIH